MDLSKLLGDLYDAEKTAPKDEDRNDEEPAEEGSPDHGGGEATTASPLATSTGPEWADEAHLDEVFASWTPGPPSDAPAAERAMGDPGASTSPDEASDGSSEQDPSERAEPLRWVRAHDDVLPHRRSGRRGLRLNLLRR